MKKRIIAFLLAAVLLLGLMPTALATGGVPQVHSSDGEITVKFDSNGGRAVSDKTFASAEALLAATLSKPYQYSKVFEGWYLKDETKPDNFGKALSEAAAADFEGKTEVTLIAKWRNRQYVIKFQPNGGTGTMADQRADFDADVKLNECTFVKEGFECAGWATYFGASKPTYTDTINREWDDGDEDLGKKAAKMARRSSSTPSGRSSGRRRKKRPRPSSMRRSPRWPGAISRSAARTPMCWKC